MIPKIPIEMQNEIKALRATGMFFHEIGKAVGCSESAAFTYGRRVEVLSTKKYKQMKKKVPDEIVLQMREMRSDGAKLQEIVKATGYAEGTVSGYTKGYATPGQIRRNMARVAVTDEARATMRKMRAEGASWHKIRKTTGYTDGIVRRITRDVLTPQQAWDKQDRERLLSKFRGKK